MESVSDIAGYSGSRRLFDDFLIAPLERAIPVSQDNCGACAVAENLHFDMAGLLDIFFEEYAGVRKIIGAQSFYALE